MADQAQGLRALVNRTRQDYVDSSLSSAGFSSDTAQEESGISDAPANADVLNPDGHSRGGSYLGMETAHDMPVLQHVTTGKATVDVRVREQLHAVPSLPSQPRRRDDSHDLAVTHAPALSSRPVARVVAITSGKGGVGKTNFSSNLAITLAARGQRVILVDADLGLANVHVVLGIVPRFHLEHVMQGEKTLKEVLYPGPGGIHIIGGGSGLTELANLDEARRSRFIQSLSELDSLADVVLLDTGAGLSHNVMSFLCAVDEVIVVTTPEPTAITDAYATIKVLSQENPRAQQRLVINMAQSEADAQAVAQRLQGIARRFLNRDLDCLGYLPHDAAVSRAVRAQQPFTLFQPNAPAARAIVQIAARLGYDEPPVSTSAAGVNGLLTRMQRFFKARSATV